MDLITTDILPVDTTDPDSDWKDLSSKTCVRILMQMAGSVCSCSAQNCHFLHLHLYLTNVLKKHFYFLFPGTHEFHLGPPRNTQATIFYVTPHCVSPECSVITSHPVASCHIITVQHGTSVEQHQTVTQHLW